MHAYQARRAFLQIISRGEGLASPAEAALQIAAEDDALVSHSAVPLPVASYLARLERMADELARWRLPELPPDPTRPLAEAQLAAVLDYLFVEKGFSVPAYGRSNLPAGSVVDHPGVWEKAQRGYLNEVLVTKRGVPAALAVLAAEVMHRLLRKGAVDFAVRVSLRGQGVLPLLEPLPGITRASAALPSGEVLNTVSFEALAEILRFLKRAYWPFAWDVQHGGFRAAARTLLEGEASAELSAISRTARHRLERGIWTSPGAGDLRRALAACERLVLLLGDAAPEERRDLAALYAAAGRPAAALAELRRFTEIGAAAGPPAAFAITERGVVAALGQPLEDQVLTDRLVRALASEEAATSGDGTGGHAADALSLESALRVPPPQRDDERRLPLTW